MPIQQTDIRAAAIETFECIQSAFPHLQMELVADPNRYVALQMNIPKQPGLSFDIWLCLQHDELQLSASKFCFEWFPCSDDVHLEEYIDAVTGLIEGRLRIHEKLSGSKVVKSVLQEPEGQGWKTIASCSGLHFPWFHKKSTRIITNQETTPSL